MLSDPSPRAGAASAARRERSAYALVVDPDTTHLRVCQTILQGQRLATAMSRDGDEARTVLRERGAPAIVVLELNLPGTDGFTLLSQMRSEFPDAKTAVIVVSAFAQLRATAAERKDELGIDWILGKDSGELFLRHAVSQALAGERRDEPLADVPARHKDPARAARMTEMRIVDDGPPDEDLQALVADTARTFGVPVALVSLVLQDRQWFKAHWGLGGDLLEKRGTPIEPAFCRHVVDASSTLVVPDAESHPYFRNNPLVRAGVLRSYAGAPLITPEGDVLGTLCIIDDKPMAIDARKVEGLEALARRVVGELHVKKSRDGTAQSEELLQATLTTLGNSLCGVGTGVIFAEPDQRLAFATHAAIEILALPNRNIEGMARNDLLREVAGRAVDAPDVLRRLTAPSEGPFVTRCEFELREPRGRMIRWIEQPVPTESGACQVCFVRDITSEVDPSSSRADDAQDSPVLSREARSRAILREVTRASQYGLPVSFVLFHVQMMSDGREGQSGSVPALVMREVSRIVQDAAIESDLVQRWGANEVMVVMQRATAKNAQSFAERVLKATKGADFCGADRIRVRTGVSQLKAGEDLHQALSRAGQRISRALADRSPSRAR